MNGYRNAIILNLMDPMRRLKLLKANFLLLLPSLLFGQDWEVIKEPTLKSAPTAYSADFQGNLYIGFNDGGLSKFSPEGDFIENYALFNASSVTLIDVQNNLKPFLFYADNQEIKILDRFATVPKVYPLSEFGIQFGMMACPAPDGDIWVAENNPQRLKKINPNRKSTLLEIQVMLGDSSQKMQAYQNFLFISTPDEVHVFDQFGGKLYSLKVSECNGFQIFENTLMIYNAKSVFEVQPTNGEILDEYSAPPRLNGLVKTRKGFFGIQKNKLLQFK